jgi:hypothetical protein
LDYDLDEDLCGLSEAVERFVDVVLEESKLICNSAATPVVGISTIMKTEGICEDSTPTEDGSIENDVDNNVELSSPDSHPEEVNGTHLIVYDDSDETLLSPILECPESSTGDDSSPESKSSSCERSRGNTKQTLLTDHLKILEESAEDLLKEGFDEYSSVVVSDVSSPPLVGVNVPTEVLKVLPSSADLTVDAKQSLVAYSEGTDQGISPEVYDGTLEEPLGGEPALDVTPLSSTESDFEMPSRMLHSVKPCKPYDPTKESSSSINSSLNEFERLERELCSDPSQRAEHSNASIHLSSDESKQSSSEEQSGMVHGVSASLLEFEQLEKDMASLRKSTATRSQREDIAGFSSEEALGSTPDSKSSSLSEFVRVERACELAAAEEGTDEEIGRLTSALNNSEDEIQVVKIAVGRSDSLPSLEEFEMIEHHFMMESGAEEPSSMGVASCSDTDASRSVEFSMNRIQELLTSGSQKENTPSASCPVHPNEDDFELLDPSEVEEDVQDAPMTSELETQRPTGFRDPFNLEGSESEICELVPAASEAEELEDEEVDELLRLKATTSVMSTSTHTATSSDTNSSIMQNSLYSTESMSMTPVSMVMIDLENPVTTDRTSHSPSSSSS